MARSGTSTKVGEDRSSASTLTREKLIAAAVHSLREQGFAGASARDIAARAGCNQGLVFYHFGSVGNLLLAALDAVSSTRMESYRAAVRGSRGLPELVEVARGIFEEDLDAGHMAVLAEMIAGSSSTPGLGAAVAQRIGPWQIFAADAIRSALEGTPLADALPADVIAHGIVALYLGLEMLAHLDGDRSRALTLFDTARGLAGFFAALGTNTREDM